MLAPLVNPALLDPRLTAPAKHFNDKTQTNHTQPAGNEGLRLTWLPTKFEQEILLNDAATKVRADSPMRWVPAVESNYLVNITMTGPHAVSSILPSAYGTVYPSAGSLLPASS